MAKSESIGANANANLVGKRTIVSVFVVFQVVVCGKLCIYVGF